TVTSTELRARFAARLSSLYGAEVPAYRTLVEVSQEVNQRVIAREGADAERLGRIERVTAERHGAIRVGTPGELAQVSRVFGALGMFPCGFYDLRDAEPAPIPVVSTAFRPLDRAELAANPFRVFTSMLVPEDRRFFDSDLEHRLRSFLASRELFPAELLALADVAIEHGELSAADADRYLELAAASFALSADPVDRAWYSELERVSGVAADIGGVTTTHINHLTPRVLDIDDLYRSMQARGIEMIDEIQGPPRWDGPDVLLRQTSFRALSEPRTFRDADGEISRGALRVRFGEVEARGIALTPAGRDRFDELVAAVDGRLADDPGLSRADVARQVWSEGLPATERDLCLAGLGFFTFRVDSGALTGGLTPEQGDALERGEVAGLVTAGVLHPDPIVYEDFLPRSAAGIFASNLTDSGTMEADQGGAERDPGWMSDVMGRTVHVPEEIYAREASASIGVAGRILGREIRPSDRATSPPASEAGSRRSR
ncbi:MAG: 2-oxoadipate dioxygenase/decarboxylase, partial [Nocardioidaceae bacterium]